jgi:hypothetical protein
VKKKDAGAIGPDAEEGAVSERRQPRIAQQDIKAQGKEGPNHHFGSQGQVPADEGDVWEKGKYNKYNRHLDGYPFSPPAA